MNKLREKHRHSVFATENMLHSAEDLYLRTILPCMVIHGDVTTSWIGIDVRPNSSERSVLR